MSSHPIQCRCGKLRGSVDDPASGARGVCYCRDCQAFAQFLGRPPGMLDALGGTDIVATSPRRVSFSQGQEHIACMSLSPRGVLRWYASCCRTPIGNTPRDRRQSHVGLVHSCLEGAGRSLDESFGPVTMRVNRHGAKGEAPPNSGLAFTLAIVRYMGSLLWSRLGGGYRTNPFFDAGSGQPVAKPQVLTLEERAALMRDL